MVPANRVAAVRELIGVAEWASDGNRPGPRIRATTSAIRAPRRALDTRRPRRCPAPGVKSRPGSAWPRSVSSCSPLGGSGAVDPLHDLGLHVFCDLKMPDIPTTVEKAARVIGSLGVAISRCTPVMTCRCRGPEWRASAAEPNGRDSPSRYRSRSRCSPVTTKPHRTSCRDAWPWPQRPTAGASCARRPTCTTRARLPRPYSGWCRVSGSRAVKHDQARPATPRAVLDVGADLLVIGRAVTHAADHAAVAVVLGHLPALSRCAPGGAPVEVSR